MMAWMRVLLAEDDAALATVIARGLRRNALALDVAHDGEVALEKASVVSYDVVVLSAVLVEDGDGNEDSAPASPAN